MAINIDYIAIGTIPPELDVTPPANTAYETAGVSPDSLEILGDPTLIVPLNNADIIGNVLVFEFTVPEASSLNNLVFRLELDTVSTFNSGNLKQYESKLSTDLKIHGTWEVKDSSDEYVSIPIGGIGPTFYNNDARVNVRLQDTTEGYPDLKTNWFWRISTSDDI